VKDLTGALAVTILALTAMEAYRLYMNRVNKDDNWETVSDGAGKTDT
jgi:hypothetical protein